MQWSNFGGTKPRGITRSTKQPPEAATLTLDSSKTKSATRARSRLSFAQTIEWTVEWYKAFAAHEDVRKATLRQIRRFEELC